MDDVLEHVYEGANVRQKLQPLHFSGDFIEADNLAELLLVHLHGTVQSPEKGYVFSRNEYVNQIRNVSHWMTLVTQIMHTQPMIIAGTALDEVDLDYYLSFRTSTSSREEGGPSILVEKTDDAITQDMCEQHKMIQFLGYSKDFFEYCAKILPNPPTPFELIPSDTRRIIPSGVSPRAALAFQADFELVPATGQKSSMTSRFLYGHSPTWHDLASDRDISRPIVSEIITYVEKRVRDSSNTTKVVLISASTGTGKTTVLRRAAFELAKKGIRALLCTALNRIDKATSSIIDLMDEPVVLIVDNFADQVSPILDMLAAIEKKDVVVLACDRTYRFKHILTVLGMTEMKVFDELPLNETEVVRLIQSYDDFGLTADNLSAKNYRSFARRLVNDPIAIACCRILNDFRPLDVIVRNLIQEAPVSSLDRYLKAGLSRQCFTTGVRYDVMASVLSSVGINDQLEVNHPLPLAYSNPTREFVVPENSTLGDRVLNNVAETNRKHLLKIFVTLANGIASRVNRKTIIQGTPEARMSQRLFNYDDVVKRLLEEEADEFYVQTKNAWRWNSRYWEQVALLKLSHFYALQGTADASEFLEAAVGHARHAVRVEMHPFTLSTLGKVLMAQMTLQGQPMKSLYDEAFEKLQNAIGLERAWLRSAVQPYASLFSGTIRYLELGGTLSSKQFDSLKANFASVRDRFSAKDDIHEISGELQRKLFH